ncbi:hypothetical protein PVK63_19410 [Aliivibrio sp. S2TY2]|uniref:hypothetical protein n=1 Tax=Aliivibrio sp. S2TY2 TaxID=3028428 RepID=UPI0023789278|nr:hypothetical protein [Aliivibrio sp. S2TY2]MDD9194117.1 hypothetical protein [Aliivibrio sp. S2TY2]
MNQSLSIGESLFSMIVIFYESYMDISLVVSILALIAAALSALYSRWSVRQAVKANDIGRLNALLAFRVHYLQLMEHQQKLAETLNHSLSEMEAVRTKYAELDEKLREVNFQINEYHTKVVNKKI